MSVLRLFRTIQLSGPTRYQAGDAVTAIDSFTKPLSGFSVLDAVDTTKAYTGKLALSHDTDFMGAEATFRIGLQYDQRTKVADENQIALTAAQATGIGMPSDYNLFSLLQKFQGEIPMGYTFRYFDKDKMRAASDAAKAAYPFVPVTANNYDVREQIYAGFAMGTLRYDWGSVVGGVRVEHIRNRGIATNITAESEHTLAFPSLHLNFKVDDSKKFRLSFNSGAARADYDQMRPNVVINDVNQTISGGNPAVRPERAYGVDGYFEWYVQPQAI